MINGGDASERQTDLFYRTIIGNLPGLVYRVLIKQDQRMVFFNDMINVMTGYNPKELTHGTVCSIDPLILPEDKQHVVQEVKNAIHENRPFRVEYRIRHKSGAIRSFVEWGKPIYGHDGTIDYIDGLIFDITDRKETEELYRTLAEKSLAGVYVVQDRKFRFINANAALYAGYLPEELNGKDSTSIVHPEDKDDVWNYAREMLSGSRIDPYEFRIVTKQGKIRWIMETVTAIFYQGKPAVLGNSMDVTEKKRHEEELQIMLLTDQLTGLYNRRGFMTLAEQQIRGANRAKKQLLLAFIDVDDMKWINETLGHEEGDKALIETANIFRQTFRESDIIARIGGDEFAVLAVDATDMDPDSFAVRLEKNIDFSNACESHPYKIAMSWGTAIYDPESPISLDQLMSMADELMYAQKKTKPSR